MSQSVPVAVNLSDTVTICQTIEGLLLDSLGPNSLHTMLTSSSGKVIITGDGSTLLDALSLSHPIARLVVGQVKSHHRVTGDNSKSYILIIAELLRQLQKAVGPNASSSANPADKSSLIKVCHALEGVISEMFPRVVVPTLLQHCFRLNLAESERENLESICLGVVRTALDGKFNMQLTRHVADLIVNLVFGSCPNVNSLDEDIQTLISEYDVTCLEIPNKPVTKSEVLDGVVLTRNFVTQSDDLKSQTSVSFVIFGCSLDKWTPDAPSTLVARNISDLSDVFQFGAVQTQQYFENLKKNQVKLVLSSELLSDTTLSFCRAAGISAVHMIPEEQLIRLAHITSTSIIYDPCDILTPSLKVGVATFCRAINLGRHAGVHLGLGENTTEKQLLLCAPTQGLCKQWFMAVFNAIKTLRMCLDTSFLTEIHATKNENASRKTSSKQKGTDGESENDSTSPNSRPSESVIQNDRSEVTNKEEILCIPGGGCTELLLHKVFKNFTKSTSKDSLLDFRNPALTTACQILSESSLCIPRCLHRNSFASRPQKASFMKILADAQESNAAFGIHGRTGMLCEPMGCGVVEPPSGRLMLWNDAVRCVCSLLRIDKIVGVVKLPKRNDDSDSSDDDF